MSITTRSSQSSSKNSDYLRNTSYLLSVFSPRKFSRRRDTGSVILDDAGHPDLWAADAQHRTNNFAQMFVSLTHMAPKLSIDRVGIEAHAAVLAKVYAEIGADGPGDALLPCAANLRDVVERLTSLFVKDPEAFALRLQIDDLGLPKDKRRALILIASELVINAIKYAFVSGQPGELSVSLTAHGDAGELTVQDNGVGLMGAESAGSGSAILIQLCALLGGSMTRTSPGRGLRVRVAFKLW